jgi:hypothetical protein
MFRIIGVFLFSPLGHSMLIPQAPSANPAKEENLPPAYELIEKGLNALGGESALERIKGITYMAPR